MVSTACASIANCRRSTLGNNEIALTSQRIQRLSMAVMAETPLPSRVAGGGNNGLLIIKTVGVTLTGNA